ncbi:MAG TPA: NAD(P)-dependent alcohol dehydrogenase [Candidatus Dormibacteraeota bacterium]|nr:NAD(P)-dependent alcohol dehydrogenase [Candidatus Dormibacteraeota bacterium]
MNAIVQHRYGPPDQALSLDEIPAPVPGDRDVLIRVRAAGVNALDWHYVEGKPVIARAAMRRGEPKVRVRGVDVAGTVEATGKEVKSLRPGDDVFGWCGGAFAELASAPEDHFLAKPSSLTYEEAAAIPVAATTALQGLRDKGRLQAGQQVLINGAGGGVGTFAVQIARALGANVTAVSRNVELMKSLHADVVIDYTREDFTKGAARYDVVFENGGSHPVAAVRKTLKPGGILVYNNGASMRRIAMAQLLSRVGQRVYMFLADLNQADLMVIRGFIDEGKVKPVVDRTFPLAETPAAILYVEAGRAQGKVVVTI